ncbi:hypothetical protein GQ457_15G006390 [Hibiscus cannabinus]
MSVVGGYEMEWGSRPDYLMRIFSRIDNEKDVMTQLMDDRDLLETIIQNEGQQLGIAEVPTHDESQQSVVNTDGSNMHSMNQHPDVVAAHRKRIRWTTELHQLFLNAVDRLGGPASASATPRNILDCMNVEGLNIYLVKSHLQVILRYIRSVLRENKRSCKVEEKKATLTESDGNIERDMGCNNQVVETLGMQDSVQKLLHEQIMKSMQEQMKKLQELLLQVEQGQLPTKLVEERLKSGSDSGNEKTAFPDENTSLFTPETASLFQKSGSPKSMTDCSSSTHSPKHDASQTDESEQCRKRHRGEGSTKLLIL